MLLACFISACATSRPGDDERVATDEDDALTFETGSLMPIDQFFGSPTSIDEMEVQLAGVLERRSRHMTDCVQAAGFGFFAQKAETREIEARPYGPDTDRVERNLYGVSLDLVSDGSSTKRTQTAEANSRSMAELSEEGLAEFNKAATACSEEAYQTHPDPRFEIGIASELVQEIARARAEMGKSPRFSALWGEWSDCMRGEGYEFQNRSEAAHSLFEDAETLSRQVVSADAELSAEVLDAVAALQDRERLLAASDVRCARSIQLDDRHNAVQLELETEILRENGDRWTLLRAADE